MRDDVREWMVIYAKDLKKDVMDVKFEVYRKNRCKDRKTEDGEK